MDNDLTYISTEDLLAELHRRSDVFVFAAAGLPTSGEDTLVLSGGSSLEVLGLLSVAQACILKSKV